MGGGHLHLIIRGTEDIYLTGNPQITFFKSVYRRYTNFAMENIQENLLGRSQLSFIENSVYRLKIPRKGDLVHHLYLNFSSLHHHY